MNYNEEYKRWLTSATADADVAAELKAIENDPAKIEDAFVNTDIPHIKADPVNAYISIGNNNKIKNSQIE